MRWGKWFGIVYLAAAAGFGAWRGDEVWTGWGTWLIVLAPLALAAAVLVIELKRQPSTKLAFVVFVMPLVACVFLSLCGLAGAWMFAEGLPRSLDPVARVAVAVAVIVIVGGLVILLDRRSRISPANESEPNSSNPPQ
jgi:hypothetical protein